MYNSHNIIICAAFTMATVFAGLTTTEVTPTTKPTPTAALLKCEHRKEINDALNSTMKCFDDFIQEQLYKNGQMCKTLDDVKNSLAQFLKIKRKCLLEKFKKSLSENQMFLVEFLEFNWRNNKTIDFLIKRKGLQCINEKKLSIRTCFLKATGYQDNSTKIIMDFGDITKFDSEHKEPFCGNVKRMNKCIKNKLLTAPTNCTQDNMDFITSLSNFVNKKIQCAEKYYPPHIVSASYSTSTIAVLSILGAIIVVCVSASVGLLMHRRRQRL